MEKKNRICAYKGDPVVPGVNKKKNGINFAVEVSGDTEASLVLYRKGAAEPETELPFTEEYRTGRMCAMLVTGLRPERYEYNFRIGSFCLRNPWAREIWCAVIER